LRRVGSPTINNLSPGARVPQAAWANVTTDLPDSSCAAQRSRQPLINILLIQTPSKAEVAQGWHCYLGGDASCALRTAPFWAVLVKSYPKGLQTPWNESNKMTVRVIGVHCLHVPLPFVPGA